MSGVLIPNLDTGSTPVSSTNHQKGEVLNQNFPFLIEHLKSLSIPTSFCEIGVSPILREIDQPLFLQNID